MKNNFTSKNIHQGFTLVELIVVIIILGILAAIALPRFTSLQRDARIAKLNAAKGSVTATSALLHASVLVKNGVQDTVGCAGTTVLANNNVAGAGSVCTENGIINMVNAYPAVSAFGTPGILAAAGLTTTFNATAAQLTTDGYGYAENVASTIATFQVIGGTNNATCSFTYQEAPLNAAPVISVVNTAGC